MDAKQPKCFVPDCYNGVGVLFPKNESAKKNWLKALRLEHLEPDLKSFVCLDHFGKNGIDMFHYLNSRYKCFATVLPFQNLLTLLNSYKTSQLVLGYLITKLFLGEPALNSKMVTPSSQMESQKVVSSKTSGNTDTKPHSSCVTLLWLQLISNIKV